jgi:hypothetical protein
LRRDAGDFAKVIAGIWPRPHTPYFAADRARRLMICYLMDHAEVCLEVEDIEALEMWSLRRLVAAFAPSSPAGLIEALRRIEDSGWESDTISALRTVLHEGGEGLKTLRHANPISKELVEMLACLPAPLRRPRIVAALETPHYATLAARSVHHCWGNKPDSRAMARMAERLERAPRRQTLFAWLVEELGLAQLAPPPVPGTDWFRPIQGSADIHRMALKFQNCLRSRIPWMLRGMAAYFEVIGDEPAIVELLADAVTWRIGEVRGFANEEISQALSHRIASYLFQAGAIPAKQKPLGIAVLLADAAGW